MATISKKVREELVHAVAERYQTSSKADKTLILDEFVRLTGYHRKHAVRVLGGRVPAKKPSTGSRPRLYDEAVRQALVVLWEASDRICGKRLRALLPLLIDALERHGHLQLEAVVREKLHRVSASTIDRLLAPARSTSARKRRAPLVQHSCVPRSAHADLARAPSFFASETHPAEPRAPAVERFSVRRPDGAPTPPSHPEPAINFACARAPGCSGRSSRVPLGSRA